MEKNVDKIRYGCIYKDAKPEQTIHKIRNILEELGILTIESAWFNNIDRIYSCRISIKGTGIGTNGKGISQEYALASAYAEFLERLQNQIIFFDKMINPKSMRKHDFIIDPNEKICSNDDIPSLPKDFLKAKLRKNDISLYHHIKKRNKSFYKVNQNNVFVPFYNLNEDKIDYLDFFLMQQQYGSNGMASGNSPEEALSQSISEVFERYIARKAFWENITFPTIPMEYIAKNAPQQYEIIEQLKQAKKVNIIIKDCSLDQGLPVIAVIMIFKDTNSFSVRFAGEPIWQIALERCITEMFQGRLFNQFGELIQMDISPKNKTIDSLMNFKRFISVGVGQYPNSLFYKDAGYQFNGFPDRKIRNNEDKLRFLVNSIKKLGFNMFIRDVSFLGFNTFFTIVPGMSEIRDFPQQRLGEIRKIYFLSNLNKLSNNELNQLAEAMENYYVLSKDESKCILLSEFLGLPVSDSIPWNQMTVEFVLSAIYFKLGEFQKSRENYCKYLEYVINYAKKNEINIDLEYHYVTKQFLGLVSLYPDDFGKIKNILNGFFDEKIVNDVISDFSKKDEIFKYIPLPNMWNCDSCDLKAYCNYKIIENFYLSTKDKIKENPINQMHIRDLVSPSEVVETHRLAGKG